MNNVQLGTARQLEKKARRAATDAYCSQVDQELDFAEDVEFYSRNGYERSGTVSVLLLMAVAAFFLVLAFTVVLAVLAIRLAG